MRGYVTEPTTALKPHEKQRQTNSFYAQTTQPHTAHKQITNRDSQTNPNKQNVDGPENSRDHNEG